MAEKIQLSIATPAREVVTTEVDEITVPGWDGEIGILPRHAPLLALLHSGSLRYRIDSENHEMAVGFGFIEVLPEKVTVLIETAESPEDIDLERALAARDRALQKLTGTVADVDFGKARAALMRALTRIRVAERGNMVERMARPH